MAAGPDHVFDGANAGDGLLGEGKRQGDGAGKFAVDVDGAAAHPLHHAGLPQRTAGEPRQDDGLVRTDIIEHAEDLHLEFLDAIPGKHGASGAVHAGADVLQREEGSLAGQSGCDRQHRGDNKTKHLTIVQRSRRYFRDACLPARTVK